MKPPKKTKPKFEAEPNAWQRFERAVDVVVKAKPKHREAVKPAPKTGAKRKPK